MITSGFGFQLDLASGRSRQWFMKSDGIKRWADTGQPVEQKEEAKQHAGSSREGYSDNPPAMAT